ncbi:MAG: PIN domain-containing protein [Betaproteobacteria bacterium]
MLVHIANDVPGADLIVAKVAAQPLASVLVSAITAHELRFMILRAKASRKHVAALQGLMHQFPVVDFDLPAAHAAADVRAHLESAGQSIGYHDTLLAGHARRLGAVLVTDDADFSRVLGLQIENWLR